MNDEQEDEDFADAFSTINPATATTDTTKPTGSGQRHSGPLSIEDFVAFPPNNTFIYLPCREPWNAVALDAILPMQQDLDRNGQPLETMRRRCLRIGDELGFLFGSGLPANFLAEYYAPSGYGPGRAAWLLFRAFCSAL